MPKIDAGLSALKIVFCLAAAACGGAVGIGAAAADPPQGANQDLVRFLPNHGNSVYQASGLLRRWPQEGPKKLWTAQIGWGKSAVVEARGAAYTATETDEQQWAVCLDPLSGQIRWKRLLLPLPNRHFVRGPVTSPVIDGERIYFIPYAINADVWDMRCPIVCLKEDGTELWRRDQDVWATEGSTPLVEGDTLYVGADNDARVVLAALDKMTGAIRWTVAVAESDRGRELAAPSSLTYQVVDGIPQVIVATYGTREVLGVHATTGQIMWRYPYPAPITIGMISTPVAVGRRLLISAGEGRGKDFFACLEMEARGGTITCRELYTSTELQNNMYNTLAVHDGAVFGFGGNRMAGFLHCTDLADGRLLWKEESREWTNHQNLVIADGLIFAITSSNKLVLAEASREGYRELGRVHVDIELGRPQQPLIANGRLYLRGIEALSCYQIAAE